jgi:hypothetical protein
MPGAPTMMPGGAGAQGMPSMPGMPDMRSAPGVPPGVGARPMPPPVNQPTEQVPGQNTAADATSLVSALDSTAPFVQAIDFLLMVFCGFYCLRRNKTAKSVALRLMSLACFVSAIILLGFFLAASYHGHPLVPVAAGVRQFSYVAARILAPFELLLFAVAIVLMARREP